MKSHRKQIHLGSELANRYLHPLHFREEYLKVRHFHLSRFLVPYKRHLIIFFKYIGLKVLNEWPTFPQLIVNGEFVGGLDIIQEMVDNGEFAEVVKGAKAE